MVKKINHAQFSQLVKLYYRQKTADGKKIPIIARGTFGVGKSAVVRNSAIELANERQRKFVEWNKITRAEKDVVSANPKDYFMLIDIRLSEMDSSDVKGLPDFRADKESIEWKIPYWAKILENPDSDGILFFDEINLATPLVISATYKIIHDRVINESKINENWLIIGCGNKDDDRAYTHELASPVKDRAGEVELTPPNIDEWCDWAVNNNIDSRIIGYLNWKPSQLHNVNFEDGQKYTTERGWERLSTLILGQDYNSIELVSGTAIGEGIAREFTGFVKLQDTINLDEIIRNPITLKRVIDLGSKYFVVSSLAERYKDNKMTFEQMFSVSEILEEMNNEEFISMLWKLCSNYNKTKFRKDFTTKLLTHPLRTKFAKYML